MPCKRIDVNKTFVYMNNKLIKVKDFILESLCSRLSRNQEKANCKKESSSINSSVYDDISTCVLSIFVLFFVPDGVIVPSAFLQ